MRERGATFGFVLALAASFLFAQPAVRAQQSAEELAKKLSNPVAAMISVPFQFNYDEDLGAADGSQFRLNFQPVVPISISENWNLISRTIIPIIDQSDIFPGAGSQSGVGDVVQSLFFSPAAPTSGGLIWGVGPVFLLPTATDDLLGAQKWAAGPTAVVLKQSGAWTYGALANHLVSFAGKDERADVNATFLQPFLSLTTPTAWSFSLNTESTYNWEASTWSVPVNVGFAKLVRIGKLPVSLGGGLRYWVESPASGPEGLGYRASVTLLFPRG